MTKTPKSTAAPASPPAANAKAPPAPASGASANQDGGASSAQTASPETDAKAPPAPTDTPSANQAEGASGAQAASSRQAVPDAACGEQVRAFLADWNADRPAEAASGSYGTTARDRWAEQLFDAIPDGTVFASGWGFVFVRGRFVGAGSLDAMAPFFVGAGQPIPMTPSA